MENILFKIDEVINNLKIKRPIFVAEADFQLEMAWVIKELYPNAKVRLEYCPEFDYTMHIDILVIINEKWIPIELKYKTKKAIIGYKNEIFHLKNHSAKDLNSYLYLKDLERIEKIKDNVNNFEKGYTVFITNDICYKKAPIKDSCNYIDFSLEDGIIKKGNLNWKEQKGVVTKKDYQNSILLKNSYLIKWNEYSKINEEKFIILINEIR